MTLRIEDFRHLVSEDVLNSYGALVQSFPKRTFDRSPWAQFGMGAVGAAMAVVCLVVSFQVVVSNKPEEQLPFQQAMWGFAAVSGILMLYGLGTGIWRAIFGIASVGTWWLLLERGLIILKNGKPETYPLDRLRIKSATGIGNKPKLLDANDRVLSLPLNAEEALIAQVVDLQRRIRRSDGQTVPTRLPYALIWAEAKWLGEDRVFRLYPDGKQVLLVYAGHFVPEKMGLGKGRLPGAAGLIGGVATAYGDWIGGKEFDKRAAHLDAMSIEELREEVRSNDASRLLTAETTTDVHLGPAITRFWSNDYLQSKVTGCLTFKHQRKPWELAFFTEEDRDFALSAMHKAFGPERLSVSLQSP